MRKWAHWWMGLSLGVSAVVAGGAAFSGCGRLPEDADIMPGKCVDCVIDQAAIEQVRAENRKLVDVTLAALPEGASVKVSKKWEAPCHGSNKQWGVAKFRARKQDQELHVDLRVLFRIFPENTTEARAREMMDSVRRGAQDAVTVWARYGIKLNLDLQSDRFSPEAKAEDFDQNPKLTDTSGRPNTGEFFYRDQGEGFNQCAELCALSVNRSLCEQKCDATRHQLVAQTSVHEFGHYLGFPDEYEEKSNAEKCPDRWISEEQSPWSFMNTQFNGIEVTDFYPRHVAWMMNAILEAYRDQQKQLEPKAEPKKEPVIQPKKKIVTKKKGDPK